MSSEAPRLSTYLRARRATSGESSSSSATASTTSAQTALVQQQTAMRAKAKASPTDGQMFVRAVAPPTAQTLHWKDFFTAHESVQQADQMHGVFRQMTAALLRLLGDVRR